MDKLRVPPRHSILLKANHNMFSIVRSMHTYYRCGKMADIQRVGGAIPLSGVVMPVMDIRCMGMEVFLLIMQVEVCMVFCEW